RQAREKLEAAERRIAEHRKVLNSIAAVARRYLPDYDEHPEIQAADELLESAAGIGVKGE
ncbi:ead/Ea22-like family protein, partial [Salmonella enterica]|nr:ead/Ea22-like family protein [Salmonella enterica]EHU5501667.1 ead/Ea22-like family protein [Salmonella enterica]ELF1176711.1 ead/Ea22-like family protein [Salmonella enterica]